MTVSVRMKSIWILCVFFSLGLTQEPAPITKEERIALGKCQATYNEKNRNGNRKALLDLNVRVSMNGNTNCQFAVDASIDNSLTDVYVYLFVYDNSGTVVERLCRYIGLMKPGKVYQLLGRTTCKPEKAHLRMYSLESWVDLEIFEFPDASVE